MYIIGLEIDNDERIILFVKMKGDLTKELYKNMIDKVLESI